MTIFSTRRRGWPIDHAPTSENVLRPVTATSSRPGWYADPFLDDINRKPFVADTRIAWWVFGVVCGAAVTIALAWATAAP
jgi:hypothetical protein